MLIIQIYERDLAILSCSIYYYLVWVIANPLNRFG